MKIKVTKDQETVYEQIADDPGVMNKVVGHLMVQPSSGATGGYITTVSHNGNDLTFRSQTLDVGTLVRLINNISMRTRATE